MVITKNLLGRKQYGEAVSRCNALLRDSSSKGNKQYWQLQAIRAEAIKLGGL